MVLRAIKGIVHAILHLALVLATTCLLLVLALGLGWLAYQARYADRIYQGVTLQGLPLGGLTPSEARELVAVEYEAGNLPIVSLRTAQQAWTVSLADMGGDVGLGIPPCKRRGCSAAAGYSCKTCSCAGGCSGRDTGSCPP